MSLPSPVPNGDGAESCYKKIIRWSEPFIGPFAGSLGIIPVFWLFERKSALQTNAKLPQESVASALVKGVKATPVICGIFGVQITAQGGLEHFLKSRQQEERKSNTQGEGKSNAFHIVLSTTAVAFASVPPLSILQGITRGMTPLQSLRRLDVYQVAMIVAREESFLLSMRINEPVNEAMAERYGQSRKVKYACAFVNGALGSLVGHMADTTFACRQNNVSITSFFHLWRGGLTKSVAVGTFNVLYTMINDIVKHVKQQ